MSYVKRPPEKGAIPFPNFNYAVARSFRLRFCVKAPRHSYDSRLYLVNLKNHAHVAY